MSELKKYFDLLELPPTAQWDEITAAYRELIKVWHPDRFANDEKLRGRAEAKSKELNEAVRQLRRHYRKTKLYRRSEINAAIKEHDLNVARPEPSASKVFQSGTHRQFRSRTSTSAVYDSIARKNRRAVRAARITGFAVAAMTFCVVAVIGIPSTRNFAALQLRQMYDPPVRQVSGYRLIQPAKTEERREMLPPQREELWAPSQRPEIIQASADCDMKRLRKLVNRGDNVNARDEIGDSALAWAARRNCKAAAELLLSAGANRNTIASNGFTPRDWAAWANSKEIAQMLAKR